MGWAQGLQSGMALGNMIRQGNERRALGEEAKKYQVTEGAYGDMSSQLEALDEGARQNLQAMKAQGASEEQIAATNAAYDQAAQELTRRQGLTSPDYSVGSGGYDGGQNYASMKEAQAAAAPLRTAGLANVYREQGNVEKADELEARALQQKAATLQVKGLERTDKEATAMQAFETDFNQLEDKTNMDAVKQLASKHNLNRSQQFTVASQMSGIEKAELEMMDTYIKKATKGKDLDGLLDLHKNDKKFADGTHFVKAVGKDGQVILNLVSDADPTKVLRTEAFKSPDMATAYLRKQAEDPGNVAEWTLGVRKLESQIRASDASVAASGAQANLSNLRAKGLSTELEGRTKAGDIAAEYEGLSDIEKAGPKGQGLIRQFNMANAKAGGQISVGPQARPGQTMTDVEKENLRAYRDWEKDDRNQKLPQAEKDKKAATMGVYQFVNPTANVVESGLGSNPYANTGGDKGAKGGAAKQQGVQTKAPQINSMNTKLISRAGDRGYNVELPDGSTRVMEQDELEDLGYRFPKGSGLSRPWYSDLMPR